MSEFFVMSCTLNKGFDFFLDAFKMYKNKTNESVYWAFW